MRRILFLLASLWLTPAFGAVTTLNGTVPGSGTAFAFDQDGSSRYFGMFSLYGKAGDFQVDATTYGLDIDCNASSELCTLLANPPAVTVNGTNEPLTGLTPGSAQTGTIYAMNSDITSIGGTAVLKGAGAVGTGSPRVAVGQDQTTIAGSNPGRTYNTIAALQTAQALVGSGSGATGDYLSHCVVFPTTVSPGVVTILDNATTVAAFAGGGTSLSNVVPFTIPVGAYSISGAWKVTTGAGLSVTCVGKFT